MVVARGCGSIEVMQWLRAHDVPWGLSVTLYAAKSGHLDLLQWMYALDPPPAPLGSVDLSVVCGVGHLPTVQWMRSLDPPVRWYGGECSSAARSGNVELMKWLREQGRPWSSGGRGGLHCMNNAAVNGRLDMVQYLLAQGCEWSADTCKDAAEGGHLEVLQFLRSKQMPSGERKEVCPWNAQECHNAARGAETRERSHGRPSKRYRLVKEWIANNFLCRQYPD